jgi:membrane protein
MSAALAYFTMLSLAPLLIMAIAIAGFVFGNKMAEAEIIELAARFTTEEIAGIIANLIKNASRPATGIVAGTISVAVLLFGASGVFSQLHDTFNDIWQVPAEKRSGILFTIRQRLIGILMVLIAGILLLASNVLSTLLSTIAESYPKAISWLNLADRSVSYLLMPFVISLIYWLIPSTKIEYRDVLPAAMLTAILISVSRYLIQLYLQFSKTSEVYGAAGSLVVLLVWVYMTGLVVFYGAAFCRAWAEIFGSRFEAQNQ